MHQPPTIAALALALAVLPALGAGASPAPDRLRCAAPATTPDARSAPRDASRGPVPVCAAPADAGCHRPDAPSWRFRADGRPLPDWRAACVHHTDRPSQGGAPA